MYAVLLFTLLPPLPQGEFSSPGQMLSNVLNVLEQSVLKLMLKQYTI